MLDLFSNIETAFESCVKITIRLGIHYQHCVLMLKHTKTTPLNKLIITTRPKTVVCWTMLHKMNSKVCILDTTQK